MPQNLGTSFPRHALLAAATPAGAYHGVVEDIGGLVDAIVEVEGFHAADDSVGGEGGVELAVGDALVGVEDAGEGVGVGTEVGGEHSA